MIGWRWRVVNWPMAARRLLTGTLFMAIAPLAAAMPMNSVPAVVSPGWGNGISAVAAPGLGNRVSVAGSTLGVSAQVVAPVGDLSPVRGPQPELTARRPAPSAPVSPAHQAMGGAQGGWQGVGHMLVLSQRGYAKSSPPMRPLARLPSGARVTSVNWRIDTAGPLPSNLVLALCMPGKCIYLDGFAGRSDALAGWPADNTVTLLAQAAGRGAIDQPLTLREFQVQVNYQGELKR